MPAVRLIDPGFRRFGAWGRKSSAAGPRCGTLSRHANDADRPGTTPRTGSEPLVVLARRGPRALSRARRDPLAGDPAQPGAPPPRDRSRAARPRGGRPGDPAPLREGPERVRQRDPRREELV